MSPSSPPRINRTTLTEPSLPRSKYRRAFEALLEEFSGRCAYSQIHWRKAGGLSAMEVDHFDPRKKNDVRQYYSNLLLASRHCNGFKSNHWPSENEQKAGIRFINPGIETDYGEHIFEDPKTHRVFGVTPAGRYQVRRCDLNAPHLVAEREERAILNDLLTKYVIVVRGPIPPAEIIRALRATIELMIPPIPYQVPISPG